MEPNTERQQENGCALSEICALRDVQKDMGTEALQRMQRTAQQIRYLNRDASALAGMINGLLETVDVAGRGEDALNGTARVSIKSLQAMQGIADRIKDKSVVVGTLMIFIDRLLNPEGNGVWETTDE